MQSKFWIFSQNSFADLGGHPASAQAGCPAKDRAEGVGVMARSLSPNQMHQSQVYFQRRKP